MDIQKFISLYYKKQGGHFFDVKTLEFFGESLDNMTVLPDRVEYTTEAGNTYKCYVLESVQHIPKSLASQGACHIRQPQLFNPRICRTFFDVETMRDVGREYKAPD